MVRLAPHPQRILFAPLIWRLALKIEQVSWNEIAHSASEAVYVLNSAQRLFKHDVHCASFDTWLEAQAAGLQVERDALGRVTNRPLPLQDWPSVEAVLAADPIARTVEIVHRLAADGGAAIPIATLTAGATLLARFGADRIDYVRQIMLGLARAYCEAGAGALVLLEEESGGDFGELPEFAALFNLAKYYATPVFLLSRRAVSPRGIAAAAAAGALLLTPDAAEDGIHALPPGDNEKSGWIAMSRWEVDPDTEPETIQAWRRQVIHG